MTIFRAVTLVAIPVVVATMCFFAGLLLGVRIQPPPDKVERGVAADEKSPEVFQPTRTEDTSRDQALPETRTVTQVEKPTDPSAETEDSPQASVNDQGQKSAPYLPSVQPSAKTPPRMSTPFRLSSRATTNVARTANTKPAIAQRNIGAPAVPQESPEIDPPERPILLPQSDEDTASREDHRVDETPLPVPNQAGGFSVQVASLADKGNADRLIVQLAAAGHTPHTRIGRNKQGKRVRVISVGPYRDRQTAQGIAAELSQQYKTQAVVLIGQKQLGSSMQQNTASKDAGRVETPPAIPNQAEGFTVQVASLADKGNADMLIVQLAAAGHTPHTRIGRDKRGKPVHVISVGPYQDRQTAQEIAAELSQQYKTQAVVFIGQNRKGNSVRVDHVSGSRSAPILRAATSTSGTSQSTGDGIRERRTYSIQVGVFPSRKHAEEIMDRLVGQGYMAYIWQTGGRSTPYSVRVGSYVSRESAQKAATRFARQNNMLAEVRALDAM